MRLEQLELPFATRFCHPSAVPVECGESRCHQEEAKSCDINYLMSRYASTGTLPQHPGVPLDGALQEYVGTDFQVLQNRMIAAKEEFDSLPSKVRDRFGNDPARLIAFLSDSANRDEAVRLGLDNAPSVDARGAPDEPQAIKEPAK